MSSQSARRRALGGQSGRARPRKPTQSGHQEAAAPGRGRPTGGSSVATEIKIPDIGDFKDVPIIEVHVKEGDPVNPDDPLVSLESDKATMEVPALQAGTVEKLLIKMGDKVSEGTPILLLRGGDGAMTQPPSLVEQQEPKPAEQPSPVSRPPAQPAAAPPVAPAPAPAAGGGAQVAASFGQAHASPSVRRLARE